MDKYWELTKTLPNSENQEVIQDFLLNLKLLNRSIGTVKQYRWVLEKFFEGRTKPLSEVSSSVLQAWVADHFKHLKETSFSMRLSVLSSFFTFCVQEGYLTHSPMKSRWFPRLPQPMPRYLEKGDIARTRQQSEKTTLRNRVMVEFMLSSGCRVGELHLLNQTDVDLHERTTHVVGKGKKIRQIHFSVKCAVLLEKYIESCPPNTEPLFTTSTGKRLSIRAIQQIVKDMGDKAGISTGLHPHRLRHTFATELLAKGADLGFISEELGHTDISTTQIYAKLPKQEIISMYRKYMG